MKKLLKLTAISLVAIFLLAGAAAPSGAAFNVPPVEYSQGLNILIYDGNAFAPESEGFERTWTAAGNTVDFVLDFDFTSDDLDDYDVLLLPRTEGISADNISAIETWFDSGEKLVWVGGESDFGGFYAANDTANPLLEELQTGLRLFSGSIEDPNSNDAAAYRTLPNATGVESYDPYGIVGNVTQGFNQLVMHGPAAVIYEDVSTGLYHDLRNATLSEVGTTGNVSIILNSSRHAIALDSDTSVRANGSDLYAYSDIDGNYPMLATDIVNESMVVVSGESIFTDYKFMYDSITENKRAWHNGSVVVDRVITHFFTTLNGYDSVELLKFTETETETETETATENVTLTETQTTTETAPFNGTLAIAGLGSVVAMTVMVRRKFN